MQALSPAAVLTAVMAAAGATSATAAGGNMRRGLATPKSRSASKKSCDPEAVPSDASIVAAYDHAIAGRRPQELRQRPARTSCVMPRRRTDLDFASSAKPSAANPHDHELHQDMRTERFDGKEWVILPSSER